MSLLDLMKLSDLASPWLDGEMRIHFNLLFNSVPSDTALVYLIQWLKVSMYRRC